MTTPVTSGMSTSSVDPNVIKQRLSEARAHLQGMLDKKRKIDKDIIEAECSLWDLETRYLEDSLHPPPQGNSSSNAFGNIVRGYEGYVKVPTTTGSHKKKAQHTKTPVDDGDRIFSLSSATATKSIQEKRPRSVGAGGEEVVGEDEDWKEEEEAREEEEEAEEEEYRDDSRQKRKKRKRK